MEANCPTCKKLLEATRAPVARVINARVVSFCSPECASGEVAHKSTDVEESRPYHAVLEQDIIGAEGADQGLIDDVAREGAVVEPTLDGEPGVVTGTRIPAAAASSLGYGGSRRKRVIALCSAIMVGGMAIAAVETISPSSPGPARAASVFEGASTKTLPAAAAVPVPPAHSEAVPGNDVVLQKAIAELQSLSGSTSLRVRRIAASALSRVGDKVAVAVLKDLAKQEESELAKAHIAYALARAGDENGRQLLRSCLSSSRRDVRLDGARYLAALGDETGRKQLTAMLRLQTHRLGAATALARLNDAKGIEVLRDELENVDSAEGRMRAAVALARAGDRSVLQTLNEILASGRFRVGAAAGLAALHETSAVPLLTEQLALSSLRVDAAKALRRLDAKVDVQPLWVALNAGDEVMRVSAAEALLVLLGDGKGVELD